MWYPYQCHKSDTLNKRDIKFYKFRQERESKIQWLILSDDD